MPDMQQQIDALREAFSADTSKAFVLKPSFPYGSPAAPVNQATPRLANQYQPNGGQAGQNVHQQGMDRQQLSQPQPVSRYHHPISPPISTGAISDMKSDSPAVQSLVMMATGQRGDPMQSMNVTPTSTQSTWNPNPLFQYDPRVLPLVSLLTSPRQWNNTFGTPQATKSPSESSPLKLLPGTQLPQLPDIHQTITNVAALPPTSQPLAPQQYSGAPMPSFVSPSMWQESVASVYEGGLKRHHGWDYEENMNSKRTR